MFFFFFKQKTAYEIKECDWSSDVCSSDLWLFTPRKVKSVIFTFLTNLRFARPLMGALMTFYEVILFARVVESPFVAFYSTESEKCHFHFPHKSSICAPVSGRVDDFLRSHLVCQGHKKPISIGNGNFQNKHCLPHIMTRLG